MLTAPMTQARFRAHVGDHAIVVCVLEGFGAYCAGERRMQWRNPEDYVYAPGRRFDDHRVQHRALVRRAAVVLRVFQFRDGRAIAEVLRSVVLAGLAIAIGCRVPEHPFVVEGVSRIRRMRGASRGFDDVGDVGDGERVEIRTQCENRVTKWIV